ncbi:glycosyltransferase family 4 protein [Sinimarinibacterium thermocellulolyticum]|uniref:Glycosyltransferase family 4 protein n=1 Tax=Sinimarinibacterium thermocellulolyticum TaxID=3170016 RepID=A0ABV2A6J0_9GAMM
MRITFVHRHFWPEPLTYALMLRHICLALAAQGHEVSVVSVRTAKTQRPDDSTELAGVRVLRITLLPEQKHQWLRRLLNTAWYLLAASAIVALGRRADVVVAATTPPVLPAWLMSTICRVRRMHFVYHYQDLHPESLSLIGAIRPSWLLSALSVLDRVSTRRAVRRVVLSNDMGRALQSRPRCGELDYTVLNNFDPGEVEAPTDADTPVQLPGAGIRVLFAGNLGLFQGLEEVIDAFTALGEQREVCLILLGDGALRSRLIQRAGACLGKTVFFLDRCTPEQAKRVMRAADLGLVSLSPGVIRYAYPSKVMTYLDAGLPLLAVVEPQSELGRMIVDVGIGHVCAPGSAEHLVQTLKVIAEKRVPCEDMRGRCRAIATERFHREQALRRWVDLFADVETGRAR